MNINEIFNNRHKPKNYYDTMQACEKCGRMITSSYDSFPDHRQDYCNACGGKTIYKCPNCQSKIRGFYHIEGALRTTTPPVPLNCHECGKAYPWRKSLTKRLSTQKSYWNYFNPAWLIWQGLIVFWKFKFYSVLITLAIGLTIAYLSWRFGWTR